MHLAKPFFDLGLTVADPALVGAFWCDQVGAVFDHVLPISDTHKQHRYDLFGSVLKLNLFELNGRGDRNGRPGYSEALVAIDGLTEPRSLTDPEGNRVLLVPPGHLGVEQIGMRIGVRDQAAHKRFFTDALRMTEVGSGRFKIGQGVLLVEQDVTTQGGGEIEDPGYRYLTFQVGNVREEHQAFLDAGGAEGWPIQQLRDVARFSMVLDPDGNWIELSQRASLTGPLD